MEGARFMLCSNILSRGREQKAEVTRSGDHKQRVPIELSLMCVFEAMKCLLSSDGLARDWWEPLAVVRNRPGLRQCSIPCPQAVYGIYVSPSCPSRYGPQKLYVIVINMYDSPQISISCYTTRELACLTPPTRRGSLH